MTKAILLILLLANQGYWFGGQDATITATWAVKADLPAAEVVWELSFNRVRVAQGTMDIKAGDASTTLTLAVPEVRVVTSMLWSYTLKRKDTGEVIQTGEWPVTLYPKKLYSDFSQRLKTRKLTIIDPQPELSDFLTANGIPNTRLSEASSLETRQADVLLVAPGAMGNAALVQERLVEQAKHGASIAVLCQDGENMIGYRLTSRPLGPLSYRLHHPLLADLDASAQEAFFHTAREIRAIALPSDEPALDVVSFSRETPGTNPVPIDGLLVTKTMGSGRIVLCQCPVPAPSQHPLAQVFYNNLLNYLLTRPEPTLAPSAREPAIVPATTGPAKNLLPLNGE